MIYTVTLNTAVDRLVRVKGELTRKHNNQTYSTTYDIGGKATHVSVALSLLNIDNVATGFAGGHTGELMVKLMEEKGCDCQFIFQDNELTRESIIVIDDTNQGSFMITQPGFSISKEKIDELYYFLESHLCEGDYCVFAGAPPAGFPIEEYERLLELVVEKKAHLCVDVSREYLEVALKLNPLFVKPNEFEFQEYVKKELNTVDEFIEELEKVTHIAQNWIVSLGKRGSLAMKQSGEAYLVTPPKIQEVNETGAGDFFVGGIVSQLYLNKSLEETLRFASAVGASKAMQTDSSSFEPNDIEWLEKEVKIERVK